MMRVACGLTERGGWGLPPSEFRAMTPREWWLIYDVNIGEARKEENETRERLKRLYYQAKAEEKERGGD